MTMSQLSVLKLYNTVVDDVIAGVRDSFLDDGVDEQVLQELKQLWKNKLQASGAMDPAHHETAMPPPPPPVLQNFQKANGNNVLTKRAVDSHMAQGSSQQSVERPVSNIAGAHPHHVIDTGNKVPVQLTLPAQPGIPGSQPRSFTIQIPASALNGNKLHQVLTGPIINATISLPQPLAATLLQQHINSALAGQQNEYDGGGGGRSGAAPFSLDGELHISESEDSDDCTSETENSNNIVDSSVSARSNIHRNLVLDPNEKLLCKPNLPTQPGIPLSQPITLQLPKEIADKVLYQQIDCTLSGAQTSFGDDAGVHSSIAPFSLDGALDSSDDEGSNVGDASDDAAGDDDEDEESPEERAEEEEEERDESGGAEEEPLNSGDDVSDEEPGDMFDTDNVVVCQYDKITRSRNKWKFYLKDGIMNLSGKDFVFQKANGDAEW